MLNLYCCVSSLYIVLRYQKDVQCYLDYRNYVYRPKFIHKTVLVSLIRYRMYFIYLPFIACLLDLPILFAVFTTINNLAYWCITRSHDQFLHLYISWILTINDEELRYRIMIYAIFLNYFSAGLSKVHRGGIKWINPETFRIFLNTFTGFIDTAWIERLPPLCSSMAIGGLIVEMVVSSLMVIDPTYVAYTIGILLAFHIAIDLTMNMALYLNMMGLLLLLYMHFYNNHTIHRLDTSIILAKLSIAVFYSLTVGDNWPFNAIEIFPFNYEQCNTIKERQRHFIVEWYSDNKIKHNYFILEYMFNAYSSCDVEFYNLFPELLAQEIYFKPEYTIVKMNKWFKERRPLINYITGKPIMVYLDNNIKQENSLKDMYGNDENWY